MIRPSSHRPVRKSRTGKRWNLNTLPNSKVTKLFIQGFRNRWKITCARLFIKSLPCGSIQPTRWQIRSMKEHYRKDDSNKISFSQSSPPLSKVHFFINKRDELPSVQWRQARMS
jgi:hypothetical protein